MITTTVSVPLDNVESDVFTSIGLDNLSDSAQGIGVQLIDANDLSISLNSPVSLFDAGTAGNHTVNWSARYIKTESLVKAGTANAIATIAFTYK